MKEMKKRCGQFKLFIGYAFLFFLCFFPWQTEIQKNNWSWIIILIMLFCNLIASFFTVDNILSKWLQLKVLKKESLKEKEILAIISGQWRRKGKVSRYEEEYDKANKKRFVIWFFVNVLILFICWSWTKIMKENGQFLNIYTYMNLLVFLFDLSLENVKNERVESLLNKGNK